MIRGILFGMVLGVLGMAACVYYYFASGRAPVAVNSPEMPLERKFARMGLHSYLAKLPHPEPAVAADQGNLIEGAKIYREHCAVCHGLPEAAKTAIAEGMAPKPPQLFKGMGVTDDEPWESYWKVKGGIRMTGMPGFNDHLTETQIWQVVVLVKHADRLTPAVKAELSGNMDATAPPSIAVPGLRK
jgi:thiosulfate dehydrogenase